MQAAFVRVHQDFTANVLRGGKPHIVKNVKEEIERDLSLDEFRYWTAVVRLAPVTHVSRLYRVSVLDGATADLLETGVMSVPAAMLFSGARDTRGSQASWVREYTNMDIVVWMHLALTLRDTRPMGHGPPLWQRRNFRWGLWCAGVKRLLYRKS